MIKWSFDVLWQMSKFISAPFKRRGRIPKTFLAFNLFSQPELIFTVNEQSVAGWISSPQLMFTSCCKLGHKCISKICAFKFYFAFYASPLGRHSRRSFSFCRQTRTGTIHDLVNLARSPDYSQHNKGI